MDNEAISVTAVEAQTPVSYEPATLIFAASQAVEAVRVALSIAGIKATSEEFGAVFRIALEAVRASRSTR